MRLRYVMLPAILVIVAAYLASTLTESTDTENNKITAFAVEEPKNYQENPENQPSENPYTKILDKYTTNG